MLLAVAFLAGVHATITTSTMTITASSNSLTFSPIVSLGNSYQQISTAFTFEELDASGALARHVVTSAWSTPSCNFDDVVVISPCIWNSTFTLDDGSSAAVDVQLFAVSENTTIALARDNLSYVNGSLVANVAISWPTALASTNVLRMSLTSTWAEATVAQYFAAQLTTFPLEAIEYEATSSIIDTNITAIVIDSVFRSEMDFDATYQTSMGFADQTVSFSSTATSLTVNVEMGIDDVQMLSAVSIAVGRGHLTNGPFSMLAILLLIAMGFAFVVLLILFIVLRKCRCCCFRNRTKVVDMGSDDEEALLLNDKTDAGAAATGGRAGAPLRRTGDDEFIARTAPGDVEEDDEAFDDDEGAVGGTGGPSRKSRSSKKSRSHRSSRSKKSKSKKSKSSRKSKSKKSKSRRRGGDDDDDEAAAFVDEDGNEAADDEQVDEDDAVDGEDDVEDGEEAQPDDDEEFAEEDVDDEVVAVPTKSRRSSSKKGSSAAKRGSRASKASRGTKATKASKAAKGSAGGKRSSRAAKGGGGRTKRSAALVDDDGDAGDEEDAGQEDEGGDEEDFAQADFPSDSYITEDWLSDTELSQSLHTSDFLSDFNDGRVA